VACADYLKDFFITNVAAESTAAVIVEPIMGEGGFITPPPEYFPKLAQICKDNGIVFIADEIQSGMGRAGRWFAVEDEDVVPDVVTTAKSVGGGMPISAVTGRSEIMDSVHVGGLGGTYGGNPVAAAASLAVLDMIERDDLLARSRAVGATIMEHFDGFAQRYEIVGDVRGRGAMCAIELIADRGTKEPLGAETMNAIARRCLEEGVLVLTAGTYGNVVRLLPPITIDDALLADGLDVLDNALGTVAG
jgi:4-aminobutyrate aminotransferase/(S)-3-amino-2-methylpropionate transaminase